MLDISGATDALAIKFLIFLFRFLLWYVGLVLVLSAITICWMAGWFRRRK